MTAAGEDPGIVLAREIVSQGQPAELISAQMAKGVTTIVYRTMWREVMPGGRWVRDYRVAVAYDGKTLSGTHVFYEEDDGRGGKVVDLCKETTCDMGD